jgi:hypothetical protein
MDIEKYKEFLLNYIPSASLVSGGKEISCRCMECPDSHDPRNKHMYISIPQNNEDPSMYHCFKCNCAGIVTYQKLIEWQIYNEDIALQLSQHNMKCSASKKNDKYYKRSVYNIYNTITTDDEISNIKLNYINNRLGTNYNYADIRRLKIVLNLYDLLNENNITSITRNKNIVDQLNINFLGFLSIDNAFLNMRRIVDEGLVYSSIDKRYINYKIFDKFDTSERFYTIPAKLDLLDPNPVKINIAEGPFDILSIYENIRNREPGIYSSIAGSNYIGLIFYFLNTFKIPYSEIHIYADNDSAGSNEKMNKIANILKNLRIKLFIHRNLMPNEKDFGVSKDKIKEGITELL